MNLPARLCPGQFPGFVGAINAVYAVLHHFFPAMPAFPSFQLEAVMGLQSGPDQPYKGMGGGTPAPSPALLACIDAGIALIANVSRDAFAVSTYPSTVSAGLPPPTIHWEAWYFPAVFDRLAPADRAHIMVAETGYLADDLVVNLANGSTPMRGAHSGSGGSGSSTPERVRGGGVAPLPPTAAPAHHLAADPPVQCAALFYSNVSASAAWLSYVIAMAEQYDMALATWWSDTDLLASPAMASCPCAVPPQFEDDCVFLTAYRQIFEAQGQPGWGGEVDAKAFATMGLRAVGGGAPKPLLAILQAARARAGAAARAANAARTAAPAAAFPVYPFTRPLSVATPPLTGSDVYILQNLLARNGGHAALPVTSAFDPATGAALAAFQSAHGLPATGALDAATAAAVLTALSRDGYVDDGAPPASLGYAYKVAIAVPTNRSIEPTAVLLSGNGSALLSFTVRLHGSDVLPPPAWPSWNSTGAGLNQFTSDGATPTGLAEFDLNAPEDNATEYGPYPVNRAVRGLRGNWAWLATNDAATMVRDGILLHTGEWNASAHGWAPPAPMPNSLGCIHAWPEDIAAVAAALTALGVEVRPNTGGALPYPFRPQGLLSVEEVGDA